MVANLPALVNQLVNDFTKFEKDGYKQTIDVKIITYNDVLSDTVGFIKFLDLLSENAFSLIQYFDNYLFSSR